MQQNRPGMFGGANRNRVIDEAGARSSSEPAPVLDTHAPPPRPSNMALGYSPNLQGAIAALGARPPQAAPMVDPQGDMPSPPPAYEGPQPFTKTQRIVGMIGDALAGMGGNAPVFARVAQQRQQAIQEAAQRRNDLARQDWSALRDHKWQQQLAAQKANEPDYFMSGKDRVRFNPATGQAEVVYDGAEPFQDYASVLGYQPGTPDYTKAVQDYVLRGSGPTAFGYDTQLDDHRTNNDMRLDGVRTQNDVSRKAAPSYRDQHPLPARTSRAAPRSRPTATGANGEKMEWNGSAWVKPR